MKKLKYLLLVFVLLLIGCNIKPIELNEFEGISFNDQSFYYDGNVHSIYVEGAPDFALITYSNNDKVEIGNYSVTAIIQAVNYETIVLTAFLKIEKEPNKNFEGITMDDMIINYDGKYHTIKPLNVPSFARVSYIGGKEYKQPNKTPYNIKTKISADGYNDLILEASLTIVGQEFEGIFVEDKAVYCDGSYYTGNLPSNVPIDARIERVGQYQFKDINNEGYTITYKITKEGYYDLLVSGKLYILGNEFEGISFDDVNRFYLNYDYEHTIKYESLPRYTNIKYECLNNSTLTNIVKDIGSYTIKSTISNKEKYYSTKELTSVVNIYDPYSCVGIDDSKTQYLFNKETFNENEFLDASNYFSVRIINKDEYENVITEYQSTFKNKVSSYTDIYVKDNLVFIIKTYEDSPSINSVTYTYMKNNKYYIVEQYPDYTSVNEYDELDAYLKVLKNETIWFNFYNFYEINEGNFTPSSYRPGSVTYYADDNFTADNNQISYSFRAMYFHPEFTHYEVCEVIIYNIGNTFYSLPEVFQV